MTWRNSEAFHVDDLAELRGLHLVHGDALDDAGVVDQDVDYADFLLYPGHEVLYLSLVGHVADVAVGLDAQLGVGGESLLHELGLDVIEHYGGSGLGVS